MVACLEVYLGWICLEPGNPQSFVLNTIKFSQYQLSAGFVANVL